MDLKTEKKYDTLILDDKLNDLYLSVLFGLLASFFGHIFFEIADYKYAYTDLREIPILIGIFYLRNPLYILPILLFGSIRFVNHYPYWATVIMHIPAAFLSYYVYHYYIKKLQNQWAVGLTWIAFVIIYYYAVILPSFVLTYEIFDLNINPSLFENLFHLYGSAYYEIISTALVTALYAVQLFFANRLVLINAGLENTIVERTKEIADANEKLLDLNSNLEQLVAQRTKRIEEQLEKFQKYAHLNSHDLRAPLARVMGLVLLLQNEQEAEAKKVILEKLLIASQELDAIIHEMNNLLSSDEL